MRHLAAGSLLVVLIGISAAVCQTQKKAQLSYKLQSIQVKGLQHLSRDKVIAASGLRVGQNATEQDFQQAVQKLGDTGLFEDVAFSYRYTSTGCDLQLQTTESQKLVPILFDNFVWFSDDELISLLRARVPLFDGRLPVMGNLTDQVNEALNAILTDRKISGRVDSIQSAAGGTIDSYIYTVKFHPVIVRNMDFPGSAETERPELLAAGKSLSGKEYLRSAMRPHEKLDFLPVYLSRGYLQASFSDSLARVVEDGPRTIVDVSFPVKPGTQYRVSGVHWAGFAAFPAGQLELQVHLKPGEPANAVQLGADLEVVQKLYGTKGYLTAYVKPVPAFDDANATVAYQLEVHEGEQFHMGDLLIDGIDQSAAGQLEAQWQMKKGSIFDDSYLHRFFQVMYHDFGLARSYSVVPKQDIDRESKTVNIALHFVPKK